MRYAAVVGEGIEIQDLCRPPATRGGRLSRFRQDAALVFLVKVFGYLIEQRNLKRQRERNREKLKFYRSQEWEDQARPRSAPS